MSICTVESSNNAAEEFAMHTQKKVLLIGLHPSVVDDSPFPNLDASKLWAG